MNDKDVWYVGTKDGWKRLDWALTDIRIDAKIKETLAIQLPTHSRRVANVGGDYGVAGVSAVKDQHVWTVPLIVLSLKTKYDFTDGVHTPLFGSGEKLPVLPLKWEPPTGMRLYLQIWLHLDGKLWNDQASYLFALDGDRRIWRLPISNLHNNCGLCYGGNTYGETQLDAVKSVCKDFTSSPWNSDLYEAPDAPHTRAMFRFKPTKDSFEQLPVEGKWQDHCQKVANDLITQNLVI